MPHDAANSTPAAGAAAAPAAGASLPPRAYWQAEQVLGAVPLSAASQVQVSVVRKEGACYLRLRAYRRVRRGGAAGWEAARQLLIFPPAALPGLRALLTAAEQALAAGGPAAAAEEAGA